ncbi:MAG: hypothetical protein RLZZ511_1191 [Cyanobacteriota bacterium]|jgi:hypothetical protein
MQATLNRLEQIENELRQTFAKAVLEPGVQNPVRFLQRWSHLSSQVPRLHGAALARVRIPDIQGLLAEIAHGECGSGDRSQIHSKLLARVIRQSPQAATVLEHYDPALIELFEATVDEVCRMDQDAAIGFIVGLEAPAYDILKLLQAALTGIAIPNAMVMQSDYMVIHEAVEKEHQDSGHEAMEIVLSNGCDLDRIYQGGQVAIRFLIAMVGEAQIAMV